MKNKPMPSNSSESNVPTDGWWGDEESARALVLATLEEARTALGEAIDALRASDEAAYASAVAKFGTVRKTAQEWISE